MLFDLSESLVSGDVVPTGPALALGGTASLCDMVQAVATNPRRATTLCRTLAKIEKTRLAGKTSKLPKLVAGFRTKVGKEAGKSLPDERARRHELDTDRQSGGVPMERQRHRGCPVYVEWHRECDHRAGFAPGRERRLRVGRLRFLRRRADARRRMRA